LCLSQEKELEAERKNKKKKDAWRRGARQIGRKGNVSCAVIIAYGTERELQRLTPKTGKRPRHMAESNFRMGVLVLKEKGVRKKPGAKEAN